MQFITPAAILFFAAGSSAAPVVSDTEASYLADLAGLGLSPVVESFENDTVWAATRNATSTPGSNPSVSSSGIRWTSNHAQNKIATGNAGGSAPDGTYAIHSLPHFLTPRQPIGSSVRHR